MKGSSPPRSSGIFTNDSRHGSWLRPVGGSGAPSKAPPLAQSVEIIKRELGVQGNMNEVVTQAAAMLGIETAGKPLPEIATLCVQALGVSE